LLTNGHPLPVVSQQTGVLTDTLRKAIAAGRLPAVKKRNRSRAGWRWRRKCGGRRAVIGPRPKRRFRERFGSRVGASGSARALRSGASHDLE